jgi:hypothetical protein
LQITNDDSGAGWAPTSTGAGAGTTGNAGTSVGADGSTSGGVTATQIINQSFGASTNSTITTQPNILDQYASYTYAISWYLLTPPQYNALTTGGLLTTGAGTPKLNTAGWSLLMQSGGAPINGRNPKFPLDYYMDDLEIETFLMGKGTNMSNNAMEIKFKVVEPNGITLLDNLYAAVVESYKTSAAANTTPTNTSTQPPNYATAQYCLVIEFYGYDAQGNLVAPASGQNSPTGQLSNTNPKAVIKKYFPFLIYNITFKAVKGAIEYYVIARPIPYVTGTSQARGTIPFQFSLSGQTVQQLLQGVTAPTSTSKADPGARTSTATTASSPPSQPDDAQTAALFNDGTGFTPGYDPNAGWGGG